MNIISNLKEIKQTNPVNKHEARIATLNGVKLTKKTKAMAKLTIIEKTNKVGEPIKHGSTLVIESEKLIGVFTKSLYIRKGFKNGTLFLSQRGNGGTDICKIHQDAEIEVNSNLFERLSHYAEKANAIKKQGDE